MLKEISKLKKEIWKSVSTKEFIAKKAGINPGVLSQIANGKLMDKRQRQRISVSLGIHEEDLFESD